MKLIENQNRAELHQWILVFTMVVIVVGMQFSHFLVSLGVMLASANFLVSGNYIQKIKVIKKRPAIWLMVWVFFMHIAGIGWSEDWGYATHDIQIKLPMLALPIVFGASSMLSKKQFLLVLGFFVATSLLSSFIGTAIYFVFSEPGDDYRNMSPFMSHIRLSLMMGLAAFVSIYLSKEVQLKKINPKWFLGIAAWFLIYLFMLRAMSGIIAVVASGAYIIWRYSTEISIGSSMFLRVGLLFIMFLIFGYVGYEVHQFYQFENVSTQPTDLKSKSGEAYHFNFDLKQVENGNYVHAYVAEKELAETWNSISKLPYNGADLKGQPLSSTLMRYLTSKNLRKDKEGVLALSHLDIWAVENGIANVRFLNSKSLSTIIYRYIWEVHNYRIGSNPQGNSLGQRFLFWKIGTQIFMENFWTGVGTGDVQMAFNEKYDQLPFKMLPKYRLRAHNQYLTMGITFGVFGLILFVVSLGMGWFEDPNHRSFLFLSFLIIMWVSMLDEDTLETQYGVTFIMFFYYLLLYHQPKLERK